MNAPMHPEQQGYYESTVTALLNEIANLNAKITQLEYEKAELMDALEDASAEFKKLPHSLGYYITHTERYVALLEKMNGNTENISQSSNDGKSEKWLNYYGIRQNDGPKVKP
jgi:predicted RNase H-like nuclease (RuvC/YqgF family)